jgi:hypothetical protein
VTATNAGGTTTARSDNSDRIEAGG